jgi:hypothetical protein
MMDGQLPFYGPSKEPRKKQRNKAAGNASHLEESPKERIVWKGATL